MNALQVGAVSVGGPLVTFYVSARYYLRHLERRTPKDIRIDAFWTALGMALIWPIGLLWLLALQPTRAERKEIERERTLEAITRSERLLGIGGENS